MTNRNTTTTKTATTNKNFSRVLYGVVNQVTQKFGLGSEAKKQVTDFIAPRISGEIKTVFPAALPEGLEATKIPSEKKVILLAYEKCQGKDVLYACIQEKPEEVVSEKKAATFEVERQLSDADRDKIILGTVGRVKSLLRGYLNISVDMAAETRIYNFIVGNPVNGRIGVLLTNNIPTGEGYSRTQVQMNDYILNLVYGENPLNNNYPYVLWVMAEETQTLQRRVHQEFAERRIRNIWESHGLPESLLGEVFKQLDLNAPIIITVYGSAGAWNKERKSKKGIVFIGQTPDPKTGDFVPNRTIGYMAGNEVAITAPGTSGQRTYKV